MNFYLLRSHQKFFFQAPRHPDWPSASDVAAASAYGSGAGRWRVRKRRGAAGAGARRRGRVRAARKVFVSLYPSASGMTRFGLTVVRHGDTRLSKEEILQGQWIDEPLSETGFKQAAAAGICLNNLKFTHIFSSDLMRTKQTVHGILEKSKFCKDMTVKYDWRLGERKYGVAEGWPLSELRAMAKAAGQECPVFTPPGGKTLDQVKMSGKDFFEFVSWSWKVRMNSFPEKPRATVWKVLWQRYFL